MPNTIRFVMLATTLLCFFWTIRANAEMRYFDIDPIGDYSYLPSPWVGISGCQNNGYRCDFEINGAFGVEFDSIARTARFAYSSFQLVGNESAQADAPPFAPVAPAVVGEWLAKRQFEYAYTSASLGDVYRHEIFSGLELMAHPNGNLRLDGGYNSTFVDGDGIDFDFQATEFVPDAADFDLDQQIDGGDFLRWQQTPNIPNGLGNLGDWVSSFGNSSSAAKAIPEPTGVVVVFSFLILSSGRRQRLLE